MAKYKTLPNYEFIRSGVYVAFNGDGIYETDDEGVIAILDECKPFINRIDIPEEPAKVKAETKPKTPAAKPKADDKPKKK